MKIAAICCTYKRPNELATAIECFLRQDYPAELRELIVLDDAGQYENQEVFHERYPAQPGPGLRVFLNWRLISVPFRFRTLGEKRNASAGLVSPDVDAYCVWDDDDVYLPWHMSAAADALADADYTIPTVIYNDKRNRVQRKSNQYLFHGAWAFRRQAFEAGRRLSVHPERTGPGPPATIQIRQAATRRPHPARSATKLRLPLVHRTLDTHLGDGRKRIRTTGASASSADCEG